ncbi:MAG TPA: hypothetical protein VGM36_15975 [Rhizomicrobium sp.]|jgi:hypothetical protein
MAKKKKKKARKAAKAAKGKRPATKAKKGKKAKKAKKAVVRKASKRKAAKKAKRPAAKKAAKRPAKKARKSKDVIGEGNYTASRNFRQNETSFIRNNRGEIAAKAKEAEAALEGPEGDELRRADEESGNRGQM